MDVAIIIGVIGSIVAGIIGSIVGGLMAIKASRIATAEAFNNSIKLQKQAQNQSIRGVILGLRTEIDMLKIAYETEHSAGEITSLEPGMPFEYYYPVNQNYFTIYESNASLIGQIPDDELRRLIIQIYLKIKGLIDTHLFNNKLLEERDRLANLNSQENEIEYSLKMDEAQNEVNEYGINIKVNYEGLVKTLAEFYPKVDSVIQILSDESNTKELIS